MILDGAYSSHNNVQSVLGHRLGQLNFDNEEFDDVEENQIYNLDYDSSPTRDVTPENLNFNIGFNYCEFTEEHGYDNHIFIPELIEENEIKKTTVEEKIKSFNELVVTDSKQTINPNRIKDIDGIFKKFFTKFLKYVNSESFRLLKRGCKKSRLKLTKLKLKPPKFPNKKFTANMTIGHWKEVLNLTLREVYSRDWGGDKLIDLVNYRKNCELVELAQSDGINKFKPLTSFLSQTMANILRMYLKSDNYFEDKEMIKENIEKERPVDECIEYMTKFSEIVEGEALIEYFENSIPKPRKKPREKVKERKLKKRFNIVKTIRD